MVKKKEVLKRYSIKVGLAFLNTMALCLKYKLNPWPHLHTGKKRLHLALPPIWYMMKTSLFGPFLVYLFFNQVRS